MQSSYPSSAILTPRTNRESTISWFGTARTHQSFHGKGLSPHFFADTEASEDATSDDSSLHGASKLEESSTYIGLSEFQVGGDLHVPGTKEHIPTIRHVNNSESDSGATWLTLSPQIFEAPTTHQPITEKGFHFTVSEIPSSANLKKPQAACATRSGACGPFHNRPWHSADDIVLKPRFFSDIRSSSEAGLTFGFLEGLCYPAVPPLNAPERIKTLEGYPRWPADLPTGTRISRPSFASLRDIVRKWRHPGGSPVDLESGSPSRATRNAVVVPRYLSRGGRTGTAYWRPPNSGHNAVQPGFEDDPFRDVCKSENEAKHMNGHVSGYENNEAVVERLSSLACPSARNEDGGVESGPGGSHSKLHNSRLTKPLVDVSDFVFRSIRSIRGPEEADMVAVQDRHPNKYTTRNTSHRTYRNSQTPNPLAFKSSNIVTKTSISPATDHSPTASLPPNHRSAQIRNQSLFQPELGPICGQFRACDSRDSICYTTSGISIYKRTTTSLHSFDDRTDFGQRTISASSSSNFLCPVDSMMGSTPGDRQDPSAAAKIPKLPQYPPSAVPSPLRPLHSHAIGNLSIFPPASQSPQARESPSITEPFITCRDFFHPLHLNPPLNRTNDARTPTPSPDTIRRYLQKKESKRGRAQILPTSMYGPRPAAHVEFSRMPPRPELYCVHQADCGPQARKLRTQCARCRRYDACYRFVDRVIRVCLCQDASSDGASVDSSPVMVQPSAGRERRDID